MGCAASTENDRSAVGGNVQTVDEASLAAALASGRKLFSNLQLSISCSMLRNKDKASLSDPFAVVYLMADSGHWTEVGRTEVVANSLSPEFVKLILVTYHFEKVQRLRVEIYDADSAFKTADATDRLQLDKQDFQGYAEITIAEIIGRKGQCWEGDLVKGKPPTAGRGRVRIVAEEVANSNSLVQIDVRASGLPRGADAFLVLSRISEMGAAARCYKTEVVKSGKTPSFARISVALSTLANGDTLRPLRIEVFDYKKSGRHILIGMCELSVNDIISRATSQEPAYLSRSQNGRGAGSDSMLIFDACTLVPQPSFFDYIAGGCSLNFVVAIDYTASNGPVNDPTSLHYQHPSGQLTEYAQAIQGVGQVLAYYDSDQLYPVYGFGGCPPGEAVANHCFAVTGNEADPCVQGIAGVLEAYYASLQRIKLHGPTLFAPVIAQATALAASTLDPERQNYWVLLLLTDGLIYDMDNCIDSLVAAAEYPISVIIVGVGRENFAPMRTLDGDDQRLRSSRGQYAVRDIVQFVAMSDFVGRGYEELAREVLAELPRQLLSYFTTKGIMPGKRQ
ncbi:Copine-domain-containing protein [Tribonema minus]|uniref:Copine-domain-containing protein n=1 Tax=Tribonema minus TaxID=303371 RepID=A0A835ZFM3_9STRA|nr:Copine-domain-containing protein [Tribonema minus]